MKWMVQAQMKISGDPRDVESRLDDVMETLVDQDVEDPTASVEMASGTATIEYVVVAPTIEGAEAQAGVVRQRLPALLSGHTSGRSIQEQEMAVAVG